MLDSLERARAAEQRFVGDASHELRTPLTALRGNLAYATRHGADPEVLADIEADAARLGVLLDDLLALAREDAAAPARGEHRRPRRARARGGRRRGGRRAGDRARRAAGARARHRQPRPQRTQATGRGGSRSPSSATATAPASAVSDEGPGLTHEQAEHAFDRFWRGPTGGSGLGLAIVRAIAERHGGTVTVAGSRFVIDLPASHDSLKP